MLQAAMWARLQTKLYAQLSPWLQTRIFSKDKPQFKESYVPRANDNYNPSIKDSYRIQYNPAWPGVWLRPEFEKIFMLGYVNTNMLPETRQKMFDIINKENAKQTQHVPPLPLPQTNPLPPNAPQSAGNRPPQPQPQVPPVQTPNSPPPPQAPQSHVIGGRDYPYN